MRIKKSNYDIIKIVVIVLFVVSGIWQMMPHLADDQAENIKAVWLVTSGFLLGLPVSKNSPEDDMDLPRKRHKNPVRPINPPSPLPPEKTDSNAS